MGVSETCRATSARSAPSLAIKKLGLIAHPSMDQWLFHLETKPTAPPGCARSAAGVQVAAAGGAQVVVRVAAAGGGGTGGGCWTPRTQDTGCFGCRLRVQASGAGLRARLRGQGETLVEPHTRSRTTATSRGRVGRDPNVEGLEVVLFAEVEQEHVLHIVRAQLVRELLGLDPPETLCPLVACRGDAKPLLNLAHIWPSVRLGLDVRVPARVPVT